jgi:hypothetical protein
MMRVIDTQGRIINGALFQDNNRKRTKIGMTAMLVLCGNCISTQPEHSAHGIASHRIAKVQQQKATAPPTHPANEHLGHEHSHHCKRRL